MDFRNILTQVRPFKYAFSNAVRVAIDEAAYTIEMLQNPHSQEEVEELRSAIETFNKSVINVNALRKMSGPEDIKYIVIHSSLGDLPDIGKAGEKEIDYLVSLYSFDTDKSIHPVFPGSRFPFHYIIDGAGDIFEALPIDYHSGEMAPNAINIYLKVSGDPFTSSYWDQSNPQFTALCKLCALWCGTLPALSSNKIITHANMDPGRSCPDMSGISANRFSIDAVRDMTSYMISLYPFSVPGSSLTSTVAFLKKEEAYTEYTAGSNGAPVSYNSAPFQHIIKPGETLHQIAKKNNMTVNAILSLPENAAYVSNPDAIYAGSIVYIPSTDATRYAEIVEAQSDAVNYAVENTEREHLISMREGNTDATPPDANVFSNMPVTQGLRFSEGVDSDPNPAAAEFLMQGYKKCTLFFSKAGSPVMHIRFLVSPGNMQVGYNEQMSLEKTASGWVIGREGMSTGSLSFSGYMLDTKNVSEKHSFLENYKKYLVSKQNAYGDYYSEMTIKVYLEGVEYEGLISGISFSKNSAQPFLYQYNLSFLFVQDDTVYAANFAKPASDGAQYVRNVTAGAFLAPKTADIIKGPATGGTI
jgi:hypothetical protein